MSGLVTTPVASRAARRVDPVIRREQILASALKLFEQRSYNDVSLTAIADEAGVARPLINHYFGGKRELYLEVVRRVTQPPPLAFDGLEASSMDDLTDAIIDYWFGMIKRNRRVWMASMNIGLWSGGDDVRRVLEEGLLVVADRLLPQLGLDRVADQAALRAAIVAIYGYANECAWQWLGTEVLTEAQARSLAVGALRATAEVVLSAEWSAGAHPTAS